jgi:hypothetical protein
MSLTQIAFLMLAAGACGGALFIVLLTMRIRYPTWFGAGHGLLGLAAIGLLGFALWQSSTMKTLPQAWWAFGVLAAALLGGVTLFRLLFPERRPIWLALMHGAVALLGLFLLYPIAFATVTP